MINFIFLISLLTASEKEVLVNKIQAVVGNQIICLSDLELRLKQVKLANKDTANIGKKKLLESMVNEILIKQYLTEKEMMPTEQDVQNSIDSIRKQYGFSEIEFKNKLIEDGISYDVFKEAKEKDLIFGRFFELELKNYINIRGSEQEAYYKKTFNKDAKTAQYRIKHILVSSQTIAKQILNEINSNNFDELAASYSLDEQTKLSGGDLGYLDRTYLNKELSEAVHNMSIQDIKGPIKTNNGYEIIKLEDIKFEYSSEYTQNLHNIKMQLIEEESQKQLEKWAEERKEVSYVKIFI